jgi:ABC-type polysaccharide/polyol phosphate export permease
MKWFALFRPLLLLITVLTATLVQADQPKPHLMIYCGTTMIRPMNGASRTDRLIHDL